jgi:two-component system cell cycle sensor histidine kinase/response regulator CckA
MPMNAFTRILIVEDLATDAELAEREINKALSSCVFQRVETREDYLAALAAFQPDLIVSDYQMPRFDGLEALKLAQEHASHTPLIILTGAMNEDTAVECMKAGATDYVIKEHIKRLGSAVIHALEEKQVRRERRRAEEALRKSEERFRGLYENATIGLYRTTPEGRILMANPAAVRMLGYDSFDELAQRDLEEMGFASACARGEFRQRLESEGVITGLESAWLRKDGSIIFVRESARAIRDERGKVLYYDGTFEDVTERKRAEQVQAAIYRISEAAQATQNLDELFAVIHAIIGELMPAKNFYIGLYDASLDLLSIPYQVDEYDPTWTPRQPGRGLTGYVLRTGKPLLATPEIFEHLVAIGEVVLIGTPGVDWLGVPLKTQRGETIGIMVIQTYSEAVRLTESDKDILAFVSTQVAMVIERKQAESQRDTTLEALRESERKFRTFIEQSTEGIVLLDEQGAIIEWNQAQERIWGLKRDEAIGNPFWEVQFRATVPERRSAERREYFRTLLLDVLRTGQSPIFNRSLEAELYRPDGERRFIRQTVFPIKTDKGYRIGSVTHDVTERKRAEAERERLLAQIQEQAQRVQQIMDTVPEGVLLLDAGAVTGWRVVLANPVAEKALAVLASEAQQTLTHLGDRPLAELLASPSDGTWHEVRVSDPPPQTFEVTARPIEAGPAAGGWVLLVREVTQERENQRRVQQQERLAAIGQLTAGIAHDFNNLLTAINGFAELGRMQFPQDAAVQELLGKILHSGRRAADLIRQLLIFSRKQTVEPIVLNINEVVSSMDKMLRRVIGEDVDLAVALTPDLWPVKVDPTQIEQVILNLAVNARDAMPRGGRLTIETANLILGEDYVAGHMGAQPGEHVLLAVSDTGVGMSDEVKAHLFEPFFTTKEPGQGTGLGLSTVFGIVKQSGGNIWVYSEVGQGTTFKIYLPHALESVQPAWHLEFKQDMPSGKETILLVEDADGVRELVRRTLQNQDYTVLEARDGQEALQMAGLHTGPIHLLLTDVIMPGISSKTLIEQVTRTYPDIRVLLISGYTDNAIMQYGVLKPGVAFLQKPFSPLELARKVRRVLDETR